MRPPSDTAAGWPWRAEKVAAERSSSRCTAAESLGRVLFTHGPGIDHPLSVIHLAFRDWPAFTPASVVWPAFAVIPLWNTDGRAPYLTFGSGSRTLCLPGMSNERCLGTEWMLAWDAYGARSNGGIITGEMPGWIGSLMEDQQDASGLLYRRNRYYDPQTGRFTQEDPTGLAGGLNLYGFAGGDPVAYSDPYGLCPKRVGGDGKTETVHDCPRDVMDAWASKHVHVNNRQRTWTHNVDQRLLDAVTHASMNGIDLTITGGGEPFGHSPRSFHSRGKAIDIGRVNGVRLQDMPAEDQWFYSYMITLWMTESIGRENIAERYSPAGASRYDRTLPYATLHRLWMMHSGKGPGTMVAHIHISLRN